MAVATPLLTGGLSALAGRARWSARVFAWDSLAYNVAGLTGPAVVTVVALVAPPTWAMVALGGCGGRAPLTTPAPPIPGASRGGRRAGGGSAAPTGRALAASVRAIAADPELRAVTTSTTVACAAIGGLSFSLVAATTALGRPPGDAGIALTASAVGGLVGSLVMTRRPPPRR